MLVLFPSDPFETVCLDASWEAEARIARSLGHRVSKIHWEGVVYEKDAARAVRHVRKRIRPAQAVYRGWPLSLDDYENLYEALLNRNIVLINTPEQYALGRYLPNWYGTLKGHTPHSQWIPGPNFKAAEAAAVIAAKPLVIRDFVRSRSKEWLDACFIERPSESRKVIRNFVERQGDALVGGIVLRDYVKLRDPEYRTLWIDGIPFLTFTRGREEVPLNLLAGPIGEIPVSLDPPVDKFRDLVSKLDSRLLLTDFTLSETGEWLILSVDDGQLAPLSKEHAAVFYKKLATHVRRKR